MFSSNTDHPWMMVFVAILFTESFLTFVTLAETFDNDKTFGDPDHKTDHEIVHPFLEFHEHARRRRSTEEESTTGDSEAHARLRFLALGREFNIELHRNKRLLAPNFKVEVLGPKGRVEQEHSASNCYLTGKLSDQSDTLVSMTHCNGLDGIIQTREGKFSIRPLHRHPTNTSTDYASSKREAHIVRRFTNGDKFSAELRHRPSVNVTKEMSYDSVLRRIKRVSPLPNFLDEIRGRKSRRDRIIGNTCGLEDLKPHVRWTRGVVSEKVGEQTIETLLVVDQKMAQYYGMDAVKHYALTIANIAHGILRDSTIGPNTVNLVITKLIVLTVPLEELAITHHARNTLTSFGRWAMGRNNPDQVNPDHFDYAVLLTKHDICVDRDQPCETLGLTNLGGMCSHPQSVAIVEDHGFGSAFTLAHQTGHSLGMDHDGTGNNCGNLKRVMESDGGSGGDAFHWSSCSIDYLQQFLRNAQSNCLENSAPRSKRLDLNGYDSAGVVYDADTQCRHAVGMGGRACYTNGTESVCAELTCFKPSIGQCVQTGKPALDGTPCGAGKWCRHGDCVWRTQLSTSSVDGGWSTWGVYSSCSRTCGGGITFRDRECLSPKPVNGGKYCVGESREYAVCNAMPCTNASSGSFRREQCRNLSLAYSGDELLEWDYYAVEPESSCMLRCQARGSSKNIEKTFGYVLDGTECQLSVADGRCIQGECQPVGCNSVLGSTDRPDRCGVCGGDGSACANELVERVGNSTSGASLTSGNTAQGYVKLKNLLDEEIMKWCNGVADCVAKLRSYGVQESNNNSLAFQWIHVSAGCSVSCGLGTEIMSPECRRTDDRTPVASAFCGDQAKPTPVYKPCTRSQCPPIWRVSTWSDCSQTCNVGRRTRTAYCVLTADREEYNLPEEDCPLATRPITEEECNKDDCPPEWFAEPFGPCSTTCGIGEQVRSVVCRRQKANGAHEVVAPGECAATPVPSTSVACNVHHPCPGDGNCGGTWTEDASVIASPNYPRFYQDNQECVYEIRAKSDKVIMLSFDSFRLRKSYESILAGVLDNCKSSDYLQIIDGLCSQASQRASVMYCGTNKPNNFTSSGNNLCLRFRSDESLADEGFQLKYSVVERRTSGSIIADVCDARSKTITSSVGILTSPNYPHPYPKNEDCRVTIKSPDATGFVLEFTTFHVGTRTGLMTCENDYLELFHGDHSERICGSTLPTTDGIKIPATEFTVGFHSTSRIDGKGFVLTFVTKQYMQNNLLKDVAPTKKSSISHRYPSDELAQRRELIRVLLQLGNDMNKAAIQKSGSGEFRQDLATRTFQRNALQPAVANQVYFNRLQAPLSAQTGATYHMASSTSRTNITPAQPWQVQQWQNQLQINRKQSILNANLLQQRQRLLTSQLQQRDQRLNRQQVQERSDLQQQLPFLPLAPVQQGSPQVLSPQVFTMASSAKKKSDAASALRTENNQIVPQWASTQQLQSMQPQWLQRREGVQPQPPSASLQGLTPRTPGPYAMLLDPSVLHKQEWMMQQQQRQLQQTWREHMMEQMKRYGLASLTQVGKSQTAAVPATANQGRLITARDFILKSGPGGVKQSKSYSAGSSKTNNFTRSGVPSEYKNQQMKAASPIQQLLFKHRNASQESHKLAPANRLATARDQNSSQSQLRGRNGKPGAEYIRQEISGSTLQREVPQSNAKPFSGTSFISPEAKSLSPTWSAELQAQTAALHWRPPIVGPQLPPPALYTQNSLDNIAPVGQPLPATAVGWQWGWYNSQLQPQPQQQRQQQAQKNLLQTQRAVLPTMNWQQAATKMAPSYWMALYPQVLTPNSMHTQETPLVWDGGQYKRQYQSMPFLYGPKADKDGCPNRLKLQCSNLGQNFGCNDSKDCLDLRLGCCLTSCPLAPKVCVLKEGYASY